MKEERSYGAVVFNNEGKVLVEYMALGHVSLPKGHIEKGETPITCALREIKEETNLVVELDTSFSVQEDYNPRPNIHKVVTFFYAIYKGKEEPVPQLEEVTSIKWEDYDIAYEHMTFDSDKRILKKAEDYHKKVIS